MCVWGWCFVHTYPHVQISEVKVIYFTCHVYRICNTNSLNKLFFFSNSFNPYIVLNLLTTMCVQGPIPCILSRLPQVRHRFRGGIIVSYTKCSSLSMIWSPSDPFWVGTYSGVCVFVPAENARETCGKRTANALQTNAISTNQIAVFKNATFPPVLSFPDTRQPMKSAFFCDVCVSLHQPIIFAFSEKRTRLRFCVRFRAYWNTNVKLRSFYNTKALRWQT